MTDASVTDGVVRSRSRSGRQALRILASLGLLGIVIAIADWRAVATVLKGARLEWVGVALALAVADRLILTYRWQVLLAAQGVLVAFGRLFKVQLAANFIGSFLPTSVGVDVVRAATLCRSGSPTPLVVAATLVDRASLILATLLFGSAMILALAQSRLPLKLEETVLALTVVVMVLGFLILVPSIRRWMYSLFMPRSPGRFAQALAEIARASLMYRRAGPTLGWVGLITLVMFVGRVLFAKSLALACGVDVPFSELLMILPILWIILMLPITVGGLGLQDAGYMALMALIGVSAPIAVSMSLIEHVLTRLVSFPGAFLIETHRHQGEPS
jgi:glycosyltransferase 2 family protein